MKHKLYFQKDAEMCYPLYWHLDYMKENNIKEMQVFRAKVEHESGMFFCRFMEQIGEKNGTCNKKDCDTYVPKNGIKGRCFHYGFCYEPTNEIIN
jgi:Uri superfamily endonuclease